MARKLIYGAGASTVFPDVPSPDITSLSPTSGGTGGGTTVRINMTFAPPSPTITVDGTSRSVTASQLGENGWYEITTQAHASGAVAIVVTTTQYGDKSGSATFTFTGAALTAGTATATRGDTQIFLSATAPTGGTAPYTYQWYRSTDGTKGASLGANFQDLVETNTSLTNGTTYYYTLDATDSAGSPATVSYTQVSATPAVPSASLTRGPGDNQPANHQQIYQLITTSSDQRTIITATQPQGQTTSTNGDTIAAVSGGNGSAAGFTYSTKWTDGSHMVFNVTDPAGELGWPCAEYRWLATEATTAEGPRCTLVDIGDCIELYLRELFYIPTDYTPHPSGVQKGLRVYRGSTALVHCALHWSDVNSNNMTLRVTPNEGPLSGKTFEAINWGSNPRPQKGRWVELEWVMTKESSVGAADGVFRVWIDGTEVTQWNQLGTDIPGYSMPSAMAQFGNTPLTFTAIHLSHYRGGSATGTLTDTEIYRQGEIFISGKTS